MQADIDGRQSTQLGRCPLCTTALIRNSAAPSRRMMVTCPSCGYSAPFISRQTHDASSVRRRSTLTGSSVWIDPAISPYFSSEQNIEPPVYPVTSVNSNGANRQASRKPQPNPSTPIPSRASAQPSSHIKVRPKYGRSTPPLEEETDLTDTPTLPQPTMWQYETPDFEIESSLPTLSLIVDAPTHPEVPMPIAPRTTRRLARSDEIDSVQASNKIVDIDEIETGLARREQPTKQIVDIDEIDRVQTKVVDIDEIETGLARREQPTKQIVDIDEIDTLPPPIELQKSSLPVPAPSPSLWSLRESGQAPPFAVTVKPPTTPVLSPLSAEDRLAELERSRLLRATNQLEKATADVPSSWTAGGASGSAYARRIAEGTKNRQYRHTASFHGLDHVRWWLLHPGRIESLLWFGGTMLLMVVTFVLLLATAVSLSWVTPDFQPQSSLTSPFQSGPTSTVSSGSGNDGNTSHANKPTVVTMNGLTLTLLSSGPLVAGQPIHLQGKDFTARGTVLFTNEKGQPVLDINSQSSVIEVDTQGGFNALLDDSGWTAGQHMIRVEDMVSSRSVNVTVVLVAGPFGKKSTPTATASTGGTFPTPVNQTPVPVSPTPRVSPTVQPSPSVTPTQTKPTPTPTMGVTPTATPIQTPTVGVTPSSTSGATGSKNGLQLIAANVADGTVHTALDSWLWLIIVGCSVALALLGLAGFIHKRV